MVTVLGHRGVVATYFAIGRASRVLGHILQHELACLETCLVAKQMRVVGKNLGPVSTHPNKTLSQLGIASTLVQKGVTVDRNCKIPQLFENRMNTSAAELMVA